MRPILAAVAALAALILGPAVPLRAQPVPAGTAPPDPRRTPAVEVFQHWKDSVIYLTGPEITGRTPTTAEFFRVDDKGKRESFTMGSGFVVHESGYVLTNAHATEKMISSYVTLSDGKKYPAELIGVARRHDLALLKIDPDRPLQPVRFGRSGDFLVGETVIVIANPHGLLQTCTVGVISAAGRATQPSGLPGIVLHDLLQTDASINPGSSGGPWFNVLGEVIGVTTSRRADSENIAFAVAISAVRQALPEMLDVERSAGIAIGLELEAPDPCRVAGVAPGSPAAVAGIRPGDVVATVDGRPILGRAEFYFALVGHKPQQTLKLQLLRAPAAGQPAAKPIEASLTLGARAKPDVAALLKQRFGMTAVPLEPARAQTMGLRSQRGVRITGLDKALYEKLKDPPLPDDVLARVNDIRPRDLDHLGLLLERIRPSEPVHMVLLRRTENLVTRIDLTITGR